MSVEKTVRAVAALLFVMACGSVHCAAPEDVSRILAHADDIKTQDNSEFVETLRRLEQSHGLSAVQSDYLRYLKAWQLGYVGEYGSAVAALKAVIAETADPVVRFRAQISLVNDEALASHYEEAYVGLNEALERQQDVPDQKARALGFAVAALLYNEAGQYDLGQSYAERWLAAEAGQASACRAAYLSIDARLHMGKLRGDSPELGQAIDACSNAGDTLTAGLLRALVANFEISQGRIDEAIKLLQDQDAIVQQTRSARVTSEFHSILARCFLLRNDFPQAKKYALSAIDKSIKNAPSKPSIDAYEVLYRVAKHDGDLANALAYHEKFAAADKGYLNDTTARTLAYQMVNQQVLDKKRQIDALNERNQVLELQGEVASKAAETERLYVTLLVFGLAFIALWAYRTKRSQMRFQNLARRDGLTGILNRQHFMDEAKVQIQQCVRGGREVALILIDLDNFKLINDTHGHAAGDSVLRQSVAVCQELMRPADLFGRLGGEEFGVLLPDCSQAVARARAEALRAAIAEMQVAGVATTVSASFGVTTSRESGPELRQMLLHADSALYRAKHEGRNRVESFSGIGESAFLESA